MNNITYSRWNNFFIFIFKSLPIFFLLLYGLTWLKYGIDIPYWDDWRSFENNNISEINLKYLFTPQNDTLYPVGRLLDSLADRYLNSNSIAYQFLSMMTVLGALLFLQWKLLVAALKDKRLAACAFTFTLFMLQPDTYWGISNLAYHQALPLVFLLGAIYVTVAFRWHTYLSSVFLFILGLLCGFSFISGAFSVLVLSMVFIAAALLMQPPERKPLLSSGLVLFASSLITLPAQLWVIVFFQKGLHRLDATWTYPFESDFWLYMLGKIGRSLALPTQYPLLSFLLTCLIVLIVIALMCWTLKTFLKDKKTTLSENKVPLIYFALASITFVYLCLVTAGRANLTAPITDGFFDMFIYGFERFHFFWVTLLWPWLIAYLLLLTKRNISSLLSIIIPIILVPYLLYVGAFAYSDYFKMMGSLRAEGVLCLIKHVQNGQEIINCPTLYPAPLMNALRHTKNHLDLPFLRTIPFFSAPSASTSTSANSSNILLENPNFHNIDILSNNSAYHLQATTDDPMIFFKTHQPEMMAKCNLLEISFLIQTQHPSYLQIFYKVPGQEYYTEEASKIIMINTVNSYLASSLQITSPTGFVDQLRLDPVNQVQQVSIKELNVKCLSQIHH